MAMTQMNVRIDEQLRLEGNAALESIGFSPAQAVRALWAFAARNANNPVKLEHDLKFLEREEALSEEAQRKLKTFHEGQKIIEEFMAQNGLSFGDVEPISDKELKELAYSELWESKGLL